MPESYLLGRYNNKQLELEGKQLFEGKCLERQSKAFGEAILFVSNLSIEAEPTDEITAGSFSYLSDLVTVNRGIFNVLDLKGKWKMGFSGICISLIQPRCCM